MVILFCFYRFPLKNYRHDFYFTVIDNAKKKIMNSVPIRENLLKYLHPALLSDGTNAEVNECVLLLLSFMGLLAFV
jgi:hypothetical protein